FFVFTTSMSEPKVTDLFVPKDGTPTPVKTSASLTVLLADGEKVFCYEGDWHGAINNNAVVKTNYSMKNGLGDIIRAKQKNMNSETNSTDGRNTLMLIIKASAGLPINT